MRLAGYAQVVIQEYKSRKEHSQSKYIATMKITDNFCCKWKPSHVYHKLTLSAVNKDEWDTK